MPRTCQITGKKPLSGRNISHAHNVTNKWQRPNIQTKRLYVPELKRTLKLKVSTRALRTIDKKGLVPYLKSRGLTVRDVT
ncbi:MAG: 50S ribosomal protein L28 [Acidobacteria bacterium]|nr:50S ribosomal protein L28 [Acidobacteriota bacterium]